jgi:hypothetical protein
VNPSVALATAAAFPDLDDDGPSLVAALASRGIDAGPAVWSDPDVDWSAYDLVVVRCTWDYQGRHEEFLSWADHVATLSTLANPADVLRWNTHKSYLRELSAAGLPVVATTWLEPGDVFAVPAQGEYVVKPAVSAGSRDTNRYAVGVHDDAAEQHASGLLAAGRTVMVQPYLDAVDTAGETALFYFAGEFSHAVRKAALLQPAMEFVSGAYKEESIDAREPSAGELAVGERVLDALPDLKGWDRRSLLYARVDVVPGADGAPTLLELELTEPSMFLIYDDQAADRFGDAIAAVVGAGRTG